MLYSESSSQLFSRTKMESEEKKKKIEEEKGPVTRAHEEKPSLEKEGRRGKNKK